MAMTSERPTRIRMTQPIPVADLQIPGILWDIDGVLCDTTGNAFRQLHGEGKLLAYGPQHVTSWDWTDSLPITKAEVYALYDQPGVLYGADHFLEGHAAYHLSAKLGLRREIVTGRRQEDFHYLNTRTWLGMHGFGCGRLHFVKSSQKAEWAKRHNIVLAVEDHFETALALSEEKVTTLLVATGYNKPEYERVDGWINPYLWRVDRCNLVNALEMAYRSLRQ